MSVVEREVEVPVVAPVTTRDVLHRAADLLEEFGWCQLDDGSKASGSMCLIGSVRAAAGDLGFNEALALRSVYASPAIPSLPMHWNDAPGRTREEVIARLREAAETA